MLSSQSNIAGYKAIIGRRRIQPLRPMLMTAAGTVLKAARVLVMGVGVAGLSDRT
jgi:NAD/NADP transhydrogenase alpha subunit